MRSEWTTKKLSDIAEFNPKESLSKGTMAKKVAMDKLQPFCRDIPGYEIEAFKGGTKFRNGDTIMARITPCLENGKTAKVSILDKNEVGFGSTEYIVFRAKQEVDEDYLYYLVCSPEVREPAIKSMVGSSGRQRVQTDVVQNLEIVVPPCSEQRVIGGILKAIDDKIAINNEINDNLLQQAGAVFDKYYNASSNQQLFTSLINVLGGGTPKTGNPDFWDGSIPFFTPKDVGAPYTFQTEKYITESGLEHCNSRLYPKNTTFVTARGTVGKVSLAGTPMAMNQSCYALASEIIDPLLVYFYVLKAVASLKHKASGAVFDAIVTRDFDIETINILTDEDAQSAVSVIAPIMEAIHNNIEENMRLSNLRDALLPKLMSGELDVSELDIEAAKLSFISVLFLIFISIGLRIFSIFS